MAGRQWNRPQTFRTDKVEALADDVLRAILVHINDHDALAETNPQRFTAGPFNVVSPCSVALIPRVPDSGFALGRITMVTSTAVAQDQDNYWTVTYRRYRVVAGAVAAHDLVSWTTATFGLASFDPYSRVLDEKLSLADVLVVRFEETGSPAPLLDLSFQVEEKYGS